VCAACYQRHRTAVAPGETTWTKLERADLTLPARKPRRKKGYRLVTGEAEQSRGLKDMGE
jgi:hypothetical protein